jgi:transglutaminase-like putative cysteine protease
VISIVTRRIAFSTGFFFLLFAVSNGQNNKVNKEAAPLWITPTSINYNQSNLDNDAEDGYIDLDFEKQVSVSSQTKYCKKAIKILSEAGVENNSEVSIDFDPSYQKLFFHTLKIIRNNKSIDKLQSAKFKVVQQEKELDKHLYDGSLTAISILEDIRPGDVIEYSYSLKGFNPIFNGKYFGFYDVQYSVPVYNLLYKLIIPSNRVPVIRNKGTEIKPSIQQLNSETVYEWKLNPVIALQIPKHTPDWYDAYPMIMVSEFKNWKEVSEWAGVLYPSNIELSPALQKKLAEIEQKNPTAESRTLAALRFVQDEVRYTGIETGENAHKPHHPDQIFNQRFGDCKDKSYLLSTMLRKMGIEADPVLINTESRKAILNWLPSPTIFDHVTVRAKINNDTYWFDPTISYQRGSLKSISYPDYQCGLVVSENTNGLTAIPLNEKGRVSVKEIFNVPDMSGPVHLTVNTTYTGMYADNTRDDFKNNSRYEMLKKYKGYYTAYFKDMKADSITYSEDETSGNVRTTEYYTVNDFWELEDGVKKASLQPFVIDGALTKPDEINRSTPYSLTFPLNYQEEIEINLPEDWRVNESSDVIETPASIFKYDYSFSGNRVTLKYEYGHLKNCIEPNELKDYLTAYKKITDNYGFSLTYNNGSTTYVKSSSSKNIETKSIFPMLYMILGLAAIITFAVRRSKRTNSF